MEKNYTIKSSENKEFVGETPDFSILLGEAIKTIGDKEPKYSISLNQFAAFIDGTDSKKKNIVKDEQKTERQFFPWYKSVGPCIKQSILTGSSEVIYDKINEFKAKKAEGRFQIPNKEGTILALENYLKTALPLDFRKLEKVEINPSVKHLDYYGIRINVAPTFVFFDERDGVEIVGAVKLITKKSSKVSSLYLRVVSTILKKYLEKHIAKENQVVDLNCCLTIDVFGKKVQIAQDDPSSPNSIILSGAKEFSLIWDKNE